MPMNMDDYGAVHPNEEFKDSLISKTVKHITLEYNQKQTLLLDKVNGD